MDESDIEIPATQEIVAAPVDESHSEIPTTQELLEFNEFIEIPATQEIAQDFPDLSHLEIPTTQEISHVELPATQEVTVDFPEMSQLEIPASQELSEVNASKVYVTTSEVSLRQEEPKSAPFSIYEDSICDTAGPKEIQRATNESKLMHVSCKENLPPLMPEMPQGARATEAMWDMCLHTPGKKVGNESAKVASKENSDLLKFSACASIEGSFKALELNPPVERVKSASPTLNIFDEDLNTERFKFPLTGEKNSTLLFDGFQKKAPEVSPLEAMEQEKLHDNSLEYNEDEIKQLQVILLRILFY